MSMSQFELWLDEIDPYALQRIVFYKCLFIATVAIYLYWLFKPANFGAFISPFFLVGLYEAPVLPTFKEKEGLLVFIGVAIIMVSISFYLVYPFRGVFFFFSTAVLAAIYFTVLKHFYALKNLTMLIIATGAIVLETQPPANLQIAYGIASSTALSMTTALICLRIFPNVYLIVWNKALQKYIQCLEMDIHSAITQTTEPLSADHIIHLGIVRNYRRLIPSKYVRHAYRVSVHIRNIQHALDNLYYEPKNEIFWYGIKDNLRLLRMSMPDYAPCGTPQMPMEPETALQQYVVRCLQQTFNHWNKICSLRKH